MYQPHLMNQRLETIKNANGSVSVACSWARFC